MEQDDARADARADVRADARADDDAASGRCLFFPFPFG